MTRAALIGLTVLIAAPPLLFVGALAGWLSRDREDNAELARMRKVATEADAVLAAIQDDPPKTIPAQDPVQAHMPDVRAAGAGDGHLQPGPRHRHRAARGARGHPDGARHRRAPRGVVGMSRRAVIAVDLDLGNGGIETAEDLARSLRILLVRASWGWLHPEVNVIDPGERA